MTSADGRPISRVGVVLHPKRDLSRPLSALQEWVAEHGAELIQLSRVPDGPDVAPDGDAADTSLIVAVGGDGTVLAALRAAAASRRPVLGVACGSLGALTTVAAGTALVDALDAFAAGDWVAQRVPALHVADATGTTAAAINDLVVVRDGGNQVSTEVEADGVLYGRFSGDGVIASTQLGSSAYGLAAGGPILAPGSDAWTITPLAPHGGCVPPLVLGHRLDRAPRRRAGLRRRARRDRRSAEPARAGGAGDRAPRRLRDAGARGGGGVVPRRPAPAADRHGLPADARPRRAPGPGARRRLSRGRGAANVNPAG